jgi:voltage-gated sodium channel
VESCKKIADSKGFQHFIIGVIILNAILMGLETSRMVDARVGGFLDALQLLIVAVFVVEIVIRILAYAPNYLGFFRDPWNVFDFVVIALAPLEYAGHFGDIAGLETVGQIATLARLARILRVVRLIGFSSKLRLIVDTLIRSLPSMGHVVLLLGLLLYTFGIIGTTLFRDIPYEDGQKPWDTLGSSMWTLFHILTFENWVAYQRPIIERHPEGFLFFMSFILLSVFIGLNMFIAVIMNNLEEAKEEQTAERHAHDKYEALLKRLHDLKLTVADLETTVHGMHDYGHTLDGQEGNGKEASVSAPGTTPPQ